MGIPSFFRNIIKKNKRLIQGAKEGEVTVDCFFIDYNSLIYTEFASLAKEEEVLPVNQRSPIHVFEKKLTTLVIEKTLYLVNDLVRPKDYVYLSMDGPAPRAKMVQQRSRRYKTVHDAAFTESLRKQFQLEPRVQWDTSCHISPGTVFMSQLSHELQKAMALQKFSCTVLLSDANVPGEGEHKFLPRLRHMKTLPTEKDKSIVIYSPDGDMISLSIMTQKSNIHILRYIDPLSEHENYLLDHGFHFLYCHMDLVRQEFYEQMTMTYSADVDAVRILTDYNFLLAMVGNDFVPSLPFLKIRSGGLDIMIHMYNELRPQFKDYLIGWVGDQPTVHLDFFKELILKLACRENTEMKKEFANLEKEYIGNVSRRREINEQHMSPYELIKSRHDHLSFFHPDHPMASTYRHLWNRIDYRKDKHVWKGQYYQYFMGVDPSHFSSYNECRTKVVTNYFESLMFTLLYYTRGCPSWTWHYKYRVSPIPSDMYTMLDKYRFNINEISFEKGTSYTPFQQLMLILPPRNKHILPPSIGNLMETTLASYYPTSFEIDALAGGKYIYSEAILPELEDETAFLQIIAEKEAELSAKDKKRNMVRDRLKKYVHTVKT